MILKFSQQYYVLRSFAKLVSKKTDAFKNHYIVFNLQPQGSNAPKSIKDQLVRIGKYRLKIVPLSSALSIEIVPPNLETLVFTMYRPNPEPFDVEVAR